jgi:xanthine/uracil permease
VACRSAEYVGIGFSVFACILLLELFGSPSMRNLQVRPAALSIPVAWMRTTGSHRSPGSALQYLYVLHWRRHWPVGCHANAMCIKVTMVCSCNTNIPLHRAMTARRHDGLANATSCLQVIIGLLVGILVAVFAGIGSDAYITGEKVEAAPVATFIWVETFPLGFYAPALLPLLIAYLVSTVESIGDITATAEASELDVVVRAMLGTLNLATGLQLEAQGWIH